MEIAVLRRLYTAQIIYKCDLEKTSQRDPTFEVVVYVSLDCSPQDLIASDAADGMGNRGYNILLRRTFGKYNVLIVQ